MFRFKFLIFAACFLSRLAISSIVFSEEVNTTQKTIDSTLIPRQILFGNAEKKLAALSHDGTRLAYVAPDANNVLNIWVRDLQNNKPDQQVTFENKRGITGFVWQFNNECILYIQDKDGDENAHLYQTHISSKETKDLTPFNGVKAGYMALSHQLPNEMLIGLNKRDPSLFDIYRLNLLTGGLQMDTENPGNVIDWVSDHNFQIRCSTSMTENGSQLFRIRDNYNEPWRDWMTISPTEIGDIGGFSADNKSLYFVTSLDSNTSRLLKINLETGERVLLAEDPLYDLDSIILHPTTHALEAVGIEREKYELFIFEQRMAADYDFLSDALKSRFFRISRDLADENWIVCTESDQKSPQYYLFRRGAKSLEFLFSAQPKLDSYQLSSMQPIQFQSRDSLTLHGYLTLPHGKDPISLPTVLYVHGGPWARDSWGFNPSAQWFANRGYAVLQINFRGSTGYGKAHLNAGNREWGNKMHDDLLDGKSWLVKKGIADPDKVAIYGGSYGGYAALVGLTFTPEEFCCAVDIVGVSNILTLMQTIPPYWKPIKVQMDIRVGSSDTEQEFLISRSPLFKVDKIKRPLLIGHGANDPRVKQAESDQIVEAMRKKNLDVEYILFEDEGHGFARPENRLKFYAAVEAFLAKYLGGRLEPASPEENWESHKR